MFKSGRGGLAKNVGADQIGTITMIPMPSSIHDPIACMGFAALGDVPVARAWSFGE